MKIELVMAWQAVFTASDQNRSVVLYSPKHCSCHVDEHPFLPLYHAILLWCVGSGELMLDAFLLKVLFYQQILELRAIVFLDLLDP